MNKHAQTPRSVLILVRGLPGSGKTHIAERLVAAINDMRGHKDSVVMLDPDAIDQASKTYTTFSESMTKEGVESIYHPNRFLKQQGYDAIDAGQMIIWNQPFTLLEGFQRSLGSLVEYAEGKGSVLPVMVVEVQIDPAVAKARIASRVAAGGHGPSDGRFDRFIQEYTTFAHLGYPTVTVQGDDDASVSVAAVMDVLKTLQK